MTGALLPGAVLAGGEYLIASISERTPSGVVYECSDQLSERAWVTELFHDRLCRRDGIGDVVAQAEEAERWTIARERFAEVAEKVSRMAHPSICGIVQKFSERGTVYIATEDHCGGSLESQISELDTFLRPRDIEAMCRALIDVLDYVHAFQIFGAKIVPETLALNDQDTSIQLLTNRLLDGTVPLPTAGPETAVDDCVSLAQTCYLMIAGRLPSDPYVPLSSESSVYSAQLLLTIDALLDPRRADKPKSAADWKTLLVRRPATQPGVVSVLERTKRLPLTAMTAPVAGLAVLIIAGFGWFGLSDSRSGVDAPSVVETPFGQPAGPWKMEIPIRIDRVVAEDGSAVHVLRITRDVPGFRAANQWMQDGLSVSRINGEAVVLPIDFQALALEGTDVSGSPGLTTLTISDQALPLERSVAIVPYLWREKSYGDLVLREQAALDGRHLVVQANNAGSKLPLEVGDKLISESIQRLPVTRFVELDAILNDALQMRNPSLSLLVQRKDGTKLVLGFAASTLVEK